MKDLGNLLKREIVSLFFLTTELLSFNIQDNDKQGKKHSRIILTCWLAGLSCKPTSFKNLGEKVSNQDIDIGSQKRYFYLGSFPQCAD